METLTQQKNLGSSLNMKVGDRVRVREEVTVYHNPENRGKPFNIQGLEGDVVGIATEWKGRPVSANFPIIVQFSGNKKFKVHLRENELEVIS